MNPAAQSPAAASTPAAGTQPANWSWTRKALATVQAENNRSADTHLHKVELPGHWGVDLYVKDESCHRTGSLKHRLARSLFLFALVNGWINEGTTVVEASSGSTAVSEAYFAQLLGLDFVAVMTRSTSPEKIALIEQFGGRCHLVGHADEVYSAAADIARESNGHYMDQFTYAERATDWRGNNNIAESIFSQISHETHPEPAWVVVGAGTGGTSATIGRYIRYHGHGTQLAVVDPEGSAFYPAWKNHDPATVTSNSSRIEGIGRPRVEPSFVPGVIDTMLVVPDAASVAAMVHFARLTGLHAGPSTGTNMWGVWQLVAQMVAAGEKGSIVTLMCDGGERYAGSYNNPQWLAAQGLDPAPHLETIEDFFATGTWNA
ncbi:cysteine synthase A [Arthrobacter stackebrandtii]|uniref:L-cysteine desulfhydrase Cds1 n=1 Tax=Arthrobacter stackebrandtii TaxID=272161 RepID=A0ABS4YYJ4_9MICC|nr:PLP-dependent cysteine synthase family protein [Arthrobacter stackebrandtii]MBP2413853.1 cysteine synthase A [Arthrobacter stackebrandtii]PYH00428.1 cysteine synthase [Arthrobacter stackebrandtii]